MRSPKNDSLFTCTLFCRHFLVRGKNLRGQRSEAGRHSCILLIGARGVTGPESRRRCSIEASVSQGGLFLLYAISSGLHPAIREDGERIVKDIAARTR